MALTTRCPHCRTAFKVVADQLRVRNGLVRCGACGTVFDGRACLEGEGAEPVPERMASSQASSPANHPPALQTPIPPAAPAPAPTPPPAPVISPLVSPDIPEPPAVLRGRDRHAAEAAPEPIYDADDRDDERGGEHGFYVDPHEHDEPSFTVGRAGTDGPDEDGIFGDVRTRFSSATDVGRAPPEFLDRDRINTRHTLRRVWGWLSLLGLLALAGQLAYVYRTPIAIAAPVLRPAFNMLCQSTGCTVGYARRIERIFIESSSLRPPPGASQAGDDGRSRLILAAVLRNRFDKAQEWPALTLSLTDMSDTVIARKIIRPEDYLPAGSTGPMGAGAEVTISVPITVSGLQVNGYQLDKFFP
jgi:predicted Zn finger-like uncharacterized protein